MVISIFRIVLLVALATAAGTAAAQKPTWSGDLRLRAQNEKDDVNAQRSSQRLRARFGLKIEIDPTLKAEIRWATTKAATSTNQTLGDSSDPGMPRRPAGLDLAYAEWKAAPFLQAYLGRIPQIHERVGGSQILLDSDIALEGLAFSSSIAIGESTKWFANAGSTWIRENFDSNTHLVDLTDNMANWTQTGVRWERDRLALKAGVGFMNFTGLQGMKFSEIAVGGAPRGNAEDPPTFVAEPYLPRQIFGEAKWPVGQWDARVFAEKTSNDEAAGESREAVWAGAGIGDRAWSLQFAYGEIGADAVPAVFTDSDFAAGSTDARGYLLQAQWKFAKSMSLGLAQFRVERSLHTVPANSDRTHLDLSASF